MLINRILSTWLCLLLLSSTMANAYDYPFKDPYVATVLNTPDEFAAVLPKELPTKLESIVIFPERKVPGVLWNMAELNYSYQAQKCPAPLIFLIAGTGASFQSPKMKIMQGAFYQAGYHVISLSSPSFTDFIVSASTSSVPGNLKEDSADLYRVMRAIWQKVEKNMKVTEFYLAGYSLGAAQSVFLSHMDEREKSFNFSKVLLINPPVNLYNSVVIIDNMLANNVPGGIDHLNEFYKKRIRAFTKTYRHGESIEFNDRYLYRAYRREKPKSDAPMAALIGVAFRISSQNMAFASDVMTQAGYVVPRGLVLKRGDSLTDYAKVLGQLTFVDYFKGIFLPHFQKIDPTITEEEIIEQMSLRSLEGYLRSSAKIGLIHNEDDIIMHPGEIAYLKDVFGKRAQIFPHGGHCGNMAYPDNIEAMVGFFQDTKGGNNDK
ncbi:alpha/beta fold hydrolase [Desulfotalea psychrophila]|uniref:Uncharacterized protein n=1 Tax=Desulfotalea psychrophila (strain LSv54 / DSM 12343) TaxID=177439 RepID=Q6AQI8_DESPS|nr:alpha/beta fold hydrolase [Desulfotalea psychrophila]CAG35385.1 conserved hypothetical protein [Desulfotalea psychrophila LSv54]